MAKTDALHTQHTTIDKNCSTCHAEQWFGIHSSKNKVEAVPFESHLDILVLQAAMLASISWKVSTSGLLVEFQSYPAMVFRPIFYIA